MLLGHTCKTFEFVNERVIIAKINEEVVEPLSCPLLWIDLFNEALICSPFIICLTPFVSSTTTASSNHCVRTSILIEVLRQPLR